MALSSTNNGYIRTGGLSTNSGWFNRDSGGTNYANQDTAEVEIDGSAVVGTVGTNTSHLDMSFYTVQAGEVGNSIVFTGTYSGTVTLTTYEILSVDTVNNRYVLDKACGTTGGKPVAYLGGAKGTLADLLSPAVMVTGNNIFITGDIVAASPTVTLPTIQNVCVFGRESDADPDSPMTITQSSGFTVLTSSNSNTSRWTWRNIDFNGGDQASSRCLSLTAGDHHFIDCTLRGYRNNAISSAARLTLTDCKIRDHTSSASTPIQTSNTLLLQGCEFYGNAVTPVTVQSNGTAFINGCQFRDNTGASTDNVLSSGTSGYVFMSNCTLDGARRGFSAGSGTGEYIMRNCVFTNATVGVYTTGVPNSVHVLDCAFYGNTTDISPEVLSTRITNKITLLGDPYTDRTNDNYRPDDTAGEGADLIGVGRPYSFNSISTRSFIGAMNRAAPSGGAAGTVGYGSW